MKDQDIDNSLPTSPQLVANKIRDSESHRSLGHRISHKDPSKAQTSQLKEIEDRFIGILHRNN
jgi:hypothetical protein